MKVFNKTVSNARASKVCFYAHTHTLTLAMQWSFEILDFGQLRSYTEN